MFHDPVGGVEFIIGAFAHSFGGTSQPKFPGGDLFSRGYQGTGADHGFFMDDHPIQNDGTDADHDIVHEVTGVQGHLVTDDDAIAEGHGGSLGTFGGAFGDMKDASILDVGLFADVDVIDIATDDDPGPHRGQSTDPDTTDDHRFRVDECLGVNLGENPFKRVDGHSGLQKVGRREGCATYSCSSLRPAERDNTSFFIAFVLEGFAPLSRMVVTLD